MAISRKTMNSKIKSEVEILETLIDNAMEKYASCFDKDGFIDIFISGEITSLDIRNQLSRMYYEAGWNTMIFKTSSENGERPGLTCIRMG